MPALNFNVTAMDRASQAFNRIADRIDMLVARLAALNTSSANVRVDVDTDPADRTLGRWTVTFRQRLRQAMSDIPVDLDLHAGATAAEQELARIRREMATLVGKEINVDITGDEALAEIQRLKAQLEALDVQHADIEVRANTAAAIADLEALLAELKRVDGQEAEVKVKADTRSFKDVLNGMALFQRTIAQLSKPFLIMAAAPGLVSLLADLQNLLGLLGLLPALAFAGMTSVLALMTAFQGFGDALSNMGDAEKFNEALKELSPNAREAAIAIKDLNTEWQGVIDVVQDATFEGVGDSLQKLGTFIPTLQAGFQGIGAAFGEMFNMWADWATQSEVVAQTGEIFENLRATIQNLAPAFTNVAAALTDMTEVGMAMLPQMANGFTDLTANFRDWIAEITANGEFEAWIQGAIDTFGQLIDLTGNVIGIFGGLFDAIEAGGQTALETLVEITAQMENFVKSAEGQAGIQAFFTTIRDIVSSLVPALEAVAKAILGTFIQIGPQLAMAGDAISMMIDSLSAAIPTLGMIASGFAPFLLALGAVMNLMGAAPGIILGVWIAFRAGSAVMAALSAAMLSFGARVEALAVSMAAMSGAAGIGGAMGALGAVVRGISTAFLGLATVLSGPLGIAILGAIAIIGILIGSSQDAGDAAADHAAKVQGLIGTLDQYTGAITDATQKQIAMDLAQTKLSDGTTSLITAVQQAGINFEVFTQAASGNEKALATVNAQLVAAADASLKTADGLGNIHRRVEEGQFAWEDYVLAVIGNVEAQQRMQEQSGLTEYQIGQLVETGRDAVGNLDELGMILGDTAGALNEAQEAAQIAAEAVANFGESLREARGALEQYGDIIDDTTGSFDPAAAGATQLMEAFTDVAFSAQATANNLARAQEALEGVGTGGQIAFDSMQASREAFIDMAVEADIGREAAENLANALGLIPEVAQLIFETNADETEADIIRIIGAIQQMPEIKSIVIDAPTEEAIAALEALGIKITNLPGGKVQLDLDDAEFQAKLQAAIDQGMTLPEFLAFLDLDIAPAQAAFDAFMNENREGGLAVPISFETGEADAQMGDLRARAETPMQAPLYLEPTPFNEGLAQAEADANALVLEPKLGLDRTPYDEKLAQALADANASIGTVTLDAVDGPLRAVLAAALAAINAAVGILTIDANPDPALGKLAATKAAVDGTTGMMTIDADNGPAIAAAGAAVAAINRMTATITVTTIQRTVFQTEGPSRASAGAGRFASGGLMHFARGGIVPGYAPGLDSIPALLSPGEAVLVPEVVKLLGARAIAGLNRLASGGRKMTIIGKNGANAYFSTATPGGRGMGANSPNQTQSRTYVLNLYNPGNSEVNLREQFRRMEVLGV